MACQNLKKKKMKSKIKMRKPKTFSTKVRTKMVILLMKIHKKMSKTKVNKQLKTISLITKLQCKMLSMKKSSRRMKPMKKLRGSFKMRKMIVIIERMRHRFKQRWMRKQKMRRKQRTMMRKILAIKTKKVKKQTHITL